MKSKTFPDEGGHMIALTQLNQTYRPSIAAYVNKQYCWDSLRNVLQDRKWIQTTVFITNIYIMCTLHTQTETLQMYIALYDCVQLLARVRYGHIFFNVTWLDMKGPPCCLPPNTLPPIVRKHTLNLSICIQQLWMLRRCHLRYQVNGCA